MYLSFAGVMLISQRDDSSGSERRTHLINEASHGLYKNYVSDYNNARRGVESNKEDVDVGFKGYQLKGALLLHPDDTSFRDYVASGQRLACGARDIGFDDVGRLFRDSKDILDKESSDSVNREVMKVVYSLAYDLRRSNEKDTEAEEIKADGCFCTAMRSVCSHVGFV